MVQFSKQHPTVSQTPAAAVKTGHDDSGWNWLGSSHGREAGNVCAFAFIKLATKDCSLPRHTRPLIWQNVPFYPGVGANKLMSLLEVTVEFQQLILIAVTLWILPTPAHTHTLTAYIQLFTDNRHCFSSARMETMCICECLSTWACVCERTSKWLCSQLVSHKSSVFQRSRVLLHHGWRPNRQRQIEEWYTVHVSVS